MAEAGDNAVPLSGNARVQIDPDGAPGAQGFTTLVTLVGVSASTITDSFFLFQ